MPTELRLIPGTLPEPYCFTSFQELYNDFFNLGQVIPVNGSRFYNLGDTEPDPDLRTDSEGNPIPWFKTDVGRWYYWNSSVGYWVRPYDTVEMSGSDVSARREIYIGTSADIVTYMGGEIGVVSAATGAFWEIDHDFDARFPLGAGTLPSTLAVAPQDTGGEEKHVLTLDELPSKSLPYQFVPSPTPPGGLYLNHDNQADTDIGVNRDSALNLGKGDAHQNMPPYFGVYFIKRTARIWVRA